MKKNYSELKKVFDGFVAGTVSPEALKPVGAPYGIYQQRNGNVMARVRINGGEIACEQLLGLADLLDAVGGHAHLTSRQDLQLHDVPAARVMEAVLASDRLGLPFKGGGGNTYRNILVGTDSGLSPDAVFDVYPYAQALHRFMLKYEKAFVLPRKLKIGFFASERDRLRAAVQDLGFLAQVRNGEKGFTVYVAGGMGRASAVGLLLFDFLPASQILRVTAALTELFHAHGDRANRHQARLRFLLKQLGAEAFLRLYLEAFAKVEVPALRVSASVAACVPVLKRGGTVKPPEGFEVWKRIAVLPTQFGDEVCSVRLFVPYGNLTANELRMIAALVAEYGSPTVRLLPTQDVLIPFVDRSALPELYKRLREEFVALDLTFASYKGHLTTCIGASVCKTGMVDAPVISDKIAAALDRYLPADTAEKQALLKVVADGLRLSGCPNCCAGHPAARIGVCCVNQNVNGRIQPFARVLTGAGVTDGVPHLTADAEKVPLLPFDEAVDVLVAACLAAAKEETDMHA